MKNFKFLLIATGISLFALFATPTPSYAGTVSDKIRDGADIVAGEDKTAKTRDIGDTVKALINTISVIVGVIAVIMIIFGGFRYITSGGNDTAVASAKNTILYAIIGLVIIALAQVIVKFVLNNINSPPTP